MDRPLRVLVLADASSIHTEQWIKGLAESGPVEIRLVTMNPAGVRPGLRDVRELRAIDEVYAGPVNAGGGNWRYVLNAPRIRQLVGHMRPDAVVALYLTSYGLMGAALKGHAALAHVILGSDVMTTPDRSPLYRAAARWALERADLIVSASEVATARLADLAHLRSGVVLTRQYGVEDWVLEHAAVPKMYSFVSNRAWVRNSRIDRVLALFSRLEAGLSLALIGGGELDSVVRAIAAGNSRVHVLGVLPHRDNVDVLAQSSFYLSMTESDGASLSLMEAMAVGAVPVVSDIAPNREWIKDGVNGVLLPSDENLAVARIERLLALPATELDAIRTRNRELVQQRGSRRRNMAVIRGRLEQVSGRGSSGA